jgi:carbohydrate kinase (thermoresistant glucokinase family)
MAALMHTVIYIMGVSGCGKTTIGQLLSAKTGIPFFDADDFHSVANKEKMKQGHPLTDADRAAWLQQLNQLAIEQAKLKGAIIACSALKERYRVILSTGIDTCEWIFLQGTYAEIYERLKKRAQHFMPAALLQSQFDSLEVPENAFTVDIKNDAETIVTMLLQHLQPHLLY